MKKFFLIFFSFFYFCYLCNAQVALNPYFWDQGLSYNPSAVGALVDESVQISIASSNRTISSIEQQLTSIIPTRINEASISDIKNLYYLSYQKSHTFESNKRLTLGLQFQKATNGYFTIQKLSTLGLTSNIHLPQKHNNTKESYWSFGMQINLLFRKPNSAVVDFLYVDATNTFGEVDPNKFRDQFKDTGSKNTLGVNYTSHKFNKSLFRFGLNFINFQHKTASRQSTSTGFLLFSNQTNNTLRAIVRYQIALNKKLLLEFNGHIRFRFIRQPYPSSIFDIRERTFDVGLGFRAGKENIFRLTIFSGDDSNVGILDGMNISFDRKKYVYNLAFVNYDWPKNATVLQSGVIYKLNYQGTPTLLRINN